MWLASSRPCTGMGPPRTLKPGSSEALVWTSVLRDDSSQTLPERSIRQAVEPSTLRQEPQGDRPQGRQEVVARLKRKQKRRRSKAGQKRRFRERNGGLHRCLIHLVRSASSSSSRLIKTRNREAPQWASWRKHILTRHLLGPLPLCKGLHAMLRRGVSSASTCSRGILEH